MMGLYEKYVVVCVLYCSWFLGAGTVPRHHICKGGTIESGTANIYSTQRLSLRHILKCTKVYKRRRQLYVLQRLETSNNTNDGI